MKELEIKFAPVDPVELAQTLTRAGFSCVRPEGLMRRKVFFMDGASESLYARVRDEGERITMTIKNILENDLHGVQEAEVVIDNFDQGVLFLEMAGWKAKAYQETRRAVWTKGDIEVCIDTWPGLPTFCEIEGPDEETMRQAVKDLGFDWSTGFFGAVDVLYKHFLGITHEQINVMPVITFDQPPRSKISA